LRHTPVCRVSRILPTIYAVGALADERAQAAQGIWIALRRAFQADELAVALGPALTEAQSRAVKLLADVPKPQPKQESGEGRTSAGWTVPPETAKPESGLRQGQAEPPKKAGKFSHLESDEAEVAAFYGSNSDGLKRNRQLVEDLKGLYGKSQVQGDSVPDNLPVEKVREALEVHHIQPLSKAGPDVRSNMIVVSATLHTLIHSDEKCVIDLTKRQMTLFGVLIPLRVDSAHNG
jgi:hypothetical protein